MVETDEKMPALVFIKGEHGGTTRNIDIEHKFDVAEQTFLLLLTKLQFLVILENRAVERIKFLLMENILYQKRKIRETE